MIRIFEMLVALFIVFVLAVLVGLALPSHGHVERSVQIPSPVRQVYDTVNTFRRFPQYSGLRAFDPAMQSTLSGPESGVGAKISWTSQSPKVGNGSLTVTKSTSDSDVTMTLDNDWIGDNKTYTITLTPAANGRTVKVTESYDADYGWNLLWRYGGLYINGEPSAIVQTTLASLSAMMAGFPNTDYTNQEIRIAEITAKPLFLVSTKAERSLDAVEEATIAAREKIDAA
ncbi:MAG: SRPBCC family protein, partial [Dokdonella sp.]|nr:SRPBCC family protein [Dokdonella sp.]